MPKAKRGTDRGKSERPHPPGIVLIIMIATFSIGTLLICAQVARLVYVSGITGDIRSRLQADYRPWTPEAFAPVSTGIALGSPEPVRGSSSILETTATQACPASAEGCDPTEPSPSDEGDPATAIPTATATPQAVRRATEPIIELTIAP
jgi:hypothetical protein